LDRRHFFRDFNCGLSEFMENCSSVMEVTVTGACADVHIQYRPYRDSQTFSYNHIQKVNASF